MSFLKQFSLLIFSLLIFVSCEKRPVTDPFETYFNLKVDGKKKSVYACGTSAMVAEYILRDTTIFAGFGCGGQGIAFT